MKPNKVRITQTPPVIKRFLMTLQKPGEADIFECKTRDELIEISHDYPFELISVPQRLIGSDGKAAGPTTGYFMIGVALPARTPEGQPVDTVRKPTLVYYYLNAEDWREMQDGIKKEVEIRKARVIKERSQWKDLGNAQ